MDAKSSMPIENLQFQECIFFGLFGIDCSSRSRRRRSATKLQLREQLGKSLSLLHNKSFKSLVCYNLLEKRRYESVKSKASVLSQPKHVLFSQRRYILTSSC